MEDVGEKAKVKHMREPLVRKQEHCVGPGLVNCVSHSPMTRYWSCMMCTAYTMMSTSLIGRLNYIPPSKPLYYSHLNKVII